MTTSPLREDRRSVYFSLLEFLFVVGVVTTLIVVMIDVLNPAERLREARTTATQFGLNELADLIIKIKGFSGNTSREITGNACSDCVCRNGSPVDQNVTCIRRWREALAHLEATGRTLGISESLEKFHADAFGSPPP